MSLASLPHIIPFKLGGLIHPSETKAKGFKGLLPNKLPFTLSAKVPELEVPYGSLGWELICRSYSNFQTELLRTNDMNSMTFSKELGAYGAASFSLNLDHPLFNQALSDGSSIETLFDYENLWEIRFDGKVIFQILGTAVTDSQLNDGETKTATVSGSGTGKVLEWASIYPIGYPDNIITKLETATDDFQGSELDRTVWANTTIDPYIIVSSQGSYADAATDRDTYQKQKDDMLEKIAAAAVDYDGKVSAYTAAVKDVNSTPQQKAELLTSLNTSKSPKSILDLKLEEIQANLDQAIQRMNFIGVPQDDETHGHLRLSVGVNGLLYKAATTKVYDFESSGVSAAIEPAASSSTGSGQIATGLKIINAPSSELTFNTSNYARMYTNRINGNLRIIAEVSNSNVVSVQDWAYDVISQKYWRIREDNGNVVFDTSPDEITWTQRFSSPYTWDSTRVALQFILEINGLSGSIPLGWVNPPVFAYLYNLNDTAIPPTETSMQVFKNYLDEAQNRGVIPYVTTMFTNDVDTTGTPWVGKSSFDVQEGTQLSTLLDSLTQIQQADWIMDADFALKVYQRTKLDETIPPVYFRRDDVVFHEAGSQISKERTRTRDNIANSIVGKNAAGQYAFMEDTESISKYQRREAFISAGTSSDLTDLGQVLSSSLEDLKDEKQSWKVVVAADQPGRQLFKDYDVGNWISIENIDSVGNITTGQWRVVGIAVNITSDASTTVELTLQSRRELLVERLKQQVTNLAASSASGGTTLGSAISAVTLVEQMTLAGLRDVVIPSPVEGDVLTYSRGFWVPITPGDKTIPNTPTIVLVNSNVYYPADGTSVRAQAEITWDVPTNSDGSFVTDGHHYELRYRPSAAAPVPATWATLASTNVADTLTWDQPVLPAMTNSGWQTIYVGWDDTTTVIQELSPGVSYDLQIRAIDSSTPQHFSDWSDSTVFITTVDTIAPAKPAPPVLASSMMAIQVTHYLGKSTGGTFNLPPDMAYLEVHAGDATFYPDDTTRIGKIIADASLIRSQTPVIQTFTLDSTQNIWIRVVAVDQTGNKSAPSNAATATINLIDDAHISDLTASKITAGTISSSIILGGVIKTAETGARAEMNFEGFRIYSENNDPTVALLGNPGTNGNFLLIKDLEDPTNTLAGIDGTGRGSFQDLTVTNDVLIGGDSLLTDMFEPLPKGIISIGYYGTTTVVGATAGNERGFLEISFIAEESRTYMICAVTEWESTAANDRLVMRLRDAGASAPTLAMPWIQQAIAVGAASAGGNAAAHITYAGTFTPGLHRILWSFAGGSGTANVNAQGNSGVESTTIIWVEDVGLPKTDTVVVNDAGVDAAGAPVSQTIIQPKPKVQYTKTYTATWSGSYRSVGDYSASDDNTMIQGDSGDEDWLNDARSLCGFDYAQIIADLNGATIKNCYITLYASHWYWNDGGTARIGTHDYTGRPAKWDTARVNEQRFLSTEWPKPGKRKVSLGSTVGDEFKAGTSKGIALGPTSGGKTQYGKFNGAGQANPPVLTIVYVK